MNVVVKTYRSYCSLRVTFSPIHEYKLNHYSLLSSCLSVGCVYDVVRNLYYRIWEPM